jgi:hypothetical protein
MEDLSIGGDRGETHKATENILLPEVRDPTIDEFGDPGVVLGIQEVPQRFSNEDVVKLAIGS